MRLRHRSSVRARIGSTCIRSPPATASRSTALISTTTNADPTVYVVVDTDVLLAATDTSRASHQDAVALLQTDERRLSLTPQIVREYLVVSTRPLEANGFALSGADAAANVRDFLKDMALLADNAASVRFLIDLIKRGPTTGKQIHDANIVAVAVVHEATAIITDNPRHFARFADLITIENLT